MIGPILFASVIITLILSITVYAIVERALQYKEFCLRYGK